MAKSLQAVLSDIGKKGTTAPPTDAKGKDVLLHNLMVSSTASTYFNKRKEADRDFIKEIIDQKKVSVALIKTVKSRQGQKVELVRTKLFTLNLETRNPSEITNLEELKIQLLARGVQPHIVEEAFEKATTLTKPAEGYKVIPIGE